MRSNPSAMLSAATNTALSGISTSLHGFARKCTDLHGPSKQTCKTNPPQTSAQSPACSQAGSDESIPDSPLPPRQLTAINLLLSGKTIVSTAHSLGVNESTVRRWKTNPVFVAELHRRAQGASPAGQFRRNKPASRVNLSRDELDSYDPAANPLDPEFQRIYDDLISKARSP